jgi:hypothetical protein
VKGCCPKESTPNQLSLSACTMTRCSRVSRAGQFRYLGLLVEIFTAELLRRTRPVSPGLLQRLRQIKLFE